MKMNKFPQEVISKQSSRREKDGYMGEEHDGLYLEMLRADKHNQKSIGVEVDSAKERKMYMRLIGQILTSPYRGVRGGWQMLRKNSDRNHQP